MAVNNFLPFSPTDTGTNLLSQADYSVAPDRSIGNQPGVASSKLVNKAMRQATAVTAQLAQYLSNKTGLDILDDGDATKLLAQMTATLLPLPQVYTRYTSGTGTHYLTYIFFIASGSATAGATYTNNTYTFTVKSTVASGTQIAMAGTGTPALSGTLTKASGTGDATLTFYAMRAPILLRAKLVGGGGGGAGSGQSAGSQNGSGGGNTTFGSSLLTANGGDGGSGAANSGNGGTATINSPAVGSAFKGGAGCAGGLNGVSGVYLQGGSGAASPYGGQGGSSPGGTASGASTNTGSGGGGAGANGIVNAYSGGGGSAGGFIDAYISGPSASYSYAIGTGGAGGVLGTGGSANGGAGAAGLLEVFESYQ